MKSIVDLGNSLEKKVPQAVRNFSEFFARQALQNPIKRQKTGRPRDKCGGVPVQNILKKVKKNLVRGRILH